MKQAVIATGGYGTRMPPALNPKLSKPLIEYAGQTMLEHLIDGLAEGGVDNYLISTGDHNGEEIRNIVKKKGIRATVLPVSHSGFRKIPHYLQDILEDQFIFVCGHHPLPGEFVSEMLQAAENSCCVLTAYDNSLYGMDKNRRILFEETGPHLRRVDAQADAIPLAHKYVRNPYVITRDIVDISAKDNFAHTFSYYVYLHWADGGSLSVVEAPMPPEFDYEHEFEKTRLFLDGMHCRRAKTA